MVSVGTIFFSACHGLCHGQWHGYEPSAKHLLKEVVLTGDLPPVECRDQEEALCVLPAPALPCLAMPFCDLMYYYPSSVLHD